MTQNIDAQEQSLLDNLMPDMETDHGGLTLGDLIVLVFDLVLLIWTGWHSYNFLTGSVPDEYSLLALVGLWGLDIGAIGWSIVWIFGSTTRYQDWTAMGFFVIDLIGVVLTSVVDSLTYGDPDAALTALLGGIATIGVPLIVVGNVMAGFAYHMTSPETAKRRTKRKMDAKHAANMQKLKDQQRKLQFTRDFLMARQQVLDQGEQLAQMKMRQDAVERSLNNVLGDSQRMMDMTNQAQDDFQVPVGVGDNGNQPEPSYHPSWDDEIPPPIPPDDFSDPR